MKKYRINTTISLKHQEILKRHAKKFGSQQNVLEHALESLENNLNHPSPELSPEAELWMRIYREIKSGMILLQRDIAKMFFGTVNIEQFREFVKNEKPAEFALEWYYNKSIKDFSFQELIDGIILQIKIQGGADTINYLEDTSSYNINMTHSMGINCSKIIIIMYESMLKSYGFEFENHFSERSVFFKVYKK